MPHYKSAWERFADVSLDNLPPRMQQSLRVEADASGSFSLDDIASLCRDVDQSKRV